MNRHFILGIEITNLLRKRTFSFRVFIRNQVNVVSILNFFVFNIETSNNQNLISHSIKRNLKIKYDLSIAAFWRILHRYISLVYCIKMNSFGIKKSYESLGWYFVNCVTKQDKLEFFVQFRKRFISAMSKVHLLNLVRIENL